MSTLVALKFLPQEQLILANSHENNELKRYRWLEHSFINFHHPVSRLMKVISMECFNRLRNLQIMAKQMDLAACIDEIPLKQPPPFYNKNERHYFVIDEPIGLKVLEQAEEAASETCTFFSWMLETNATPELHQLLFDFVTQKNNEHRVLQECREQWIISFHSLSHATKKVR